MQIMIFILVLIVLLLSFAVRSLFQAKLYFATKWQEEIFTTNKLKETIRHRESDAFLGGLIRSMQSNRQIRFMVIVSKDEETDIGVWHVNDLYPRYVFRTESGFVLYVCPYVPPLRISLFSLKDKNGVVTLTPSRQVMYVMSNTSDIMQLATVGLKPKPVKMERSEIVIGQPLYMAEFDLFV